MKTEINKMKRFMDVASLKEMELVELHEKETHKITGGSLVGLIRAFTKLFSSHENTASSPSSNQSVLNILHP